MNARLRDTEAWAGLTARQKLAAAVYLAAEYVLLLAMPIALLAALADVRAAGYVVIVALTIHIVGRHLAVWAFADRDDADVPRPERTAAIVGAGSMVLLAAGLFVALAGWEPGAYIAVGALVGLLVSHLVVGGLAYRRAMAHPWPDVPPVLDDDW